MQKPNNIEDSWLIIQYQNGHKKAMTLLVKRWHAKFCNQAYYYVKDAAIAKDIAQESWQQIIAKFSEIKESEKFGSWGLTIVRRKSIDWLRKEKRDFEKLKIYFEEERQDFEPALKNTEIIEKLRKTIESLSLQQQIIIRVFYTEGYSLQEIAEQLNLSKGTVKSRLFYAREKLKLKLKYRNYEE
jgi:RNA polymerase sigma-70 factor (ECF subfamily)